jgi:hypothetical protein
VAGDAVCDACNRRDRSHETDTFLLRSTGLLGVCPAKSREFYFGVVGEAPFAQSINRRYGINPLPLRLTGAFMGKLLQLGPCAGPPNVRLLIRYGCSSRRAAGRVGGTATAGHQQSAARAVALLPAVGGRSPGRYDCLESPTALRLGHLSRTHAPPPTFPFNLSRLPAGGILHAGAAICT